MNTNWSLCFEIYLFFFNQAIIRKCGSLGLANTYRTNRKVKKIVSLLIALALLPAN